MFFLVHKGKSWEMFNQEGRHNQFCTIEVPVSALKGCLGESRVER